jgi:hypothetical protein
VGTLIKEDDRVFIGEKKSKGIFKVRIELAKAFAPVLDVDGSTADPGEPELEKVFHEDWIIMREPRSEEVFKAQTGDATKVGASYMELFPSCLLDWSFMRAENEKASREEVLEIIGQSSTLYTYVLERWGVALPLARKSGRASIAPLAR